MDVPMYFVYRNGQYVNALGMSWRDFMAGKLPALPGAYGAWQHRTVGATKRYGLRDVTHLGPRKGSVTGGWKRSTAFRTNNIAGL